MRDPFRITLVILFSLTSIVYCSFEHSNSGAENLALGNSTIASINNLYAIFYNPAGISRNNEIKLSSTYRNYYGLKDINQISVVTIFSILTKRFSIGFERFGNNLYNENRILIGSAFSLSNKMNVGITISFNSLSISNYGSNSSMSFSVGFLYIINSKIFLGVTLSDFYGINTVDGENANNSDFEIGFAYVPLSNIKLYSTISRNIRFRAEFNLGIEYLFQDHIIIRFGYENSIDTISSGIGVSIDSVTFNYAFRWHTWLGASYAVALEISI
jgi:hypothetical protein